MENNIYADKYSRSLRLVIIDERLNKGEQLSKKKLAEEYGVMPKSIQRDIEDLRAYYITQRNADIVYDRSKKTYHMEKINKNWLTSSEIFSVCKVLLESRAFRKDEMENIISKLISQVNAGDRKDVEKLMLSERVGYIPLQHGKKLVELIWQLSKYICECKEISFSYKRQDGKIKSHTVKPAAVMFSEFYFYLIAFGDEDIKSNIIYRVDRMERIRPTGKTFSIPYRDQFSEGEFRKRVQFMYGGELRHVKFEYRGVLEAVMDKFPTAKIMDEKDGAYIITVEGFGKGVDMWLKAQGDLVKFL